ncbi:trapp complex protein trs85 [Zalerion maritima]|uniref:Trapp complex protein trs85 n=1 Tax=Zalerion maritima TaxID=339359 RepID=A0AAD5WNI2_9PEZI|nr:trapp complex protein trs85 [Zalerion maritima]
MEKRSPSSSSPKHNPLNQLRNFIPISPEIAAPARAATSGDGSISQSVASLPFARPNPSAASLFASTLTPPGSRSMSPIGRGSPSRVIASSIFRNPIDSPSSTQPPPDSPAHILTGAFIPHIAVYASNDTDRLAADKGFPSGLWELLRPFGERIHGKVTIRDSNGISRSLDDFAVRFFRLGHHIEPPDPTPGVPTKPSSTLNGNVGQSAPGSSPARKAPWSKTVVHDAEAVIERHLTYAEQAAAGLGHLNSLVPQGPEQGTTSPYYSLYLRRLLSGIAASPHETFSHPVACIIVISSRNPDPIVTLRSLYAESSKGEAQLPPWIEQEYLRYYVLVHDEERDNIARSMSLYDQMKRHFGLHCHLLRLRGSQGAETDDDSIPLPRSDWMTASEELALLKRTDGGEDFEDPVRYIFESDATAIRTFTREMVTQSIIPTMERSVSVWNDQVASRRRGLGGRILNLSRRWGGFGGGASRSSMIGSSSSTSNYDQAGGFYKPEAAEATMRRLADYAFMLRDWKLAYSTYDLLRSDYSTDKAWKFHAAANEMAAISILMNPQSITSKTRTETVDQLLEAAFYSYQTRCMATYGAIRTVLLGMELLRLRGGSSIDDAVRWGVRLLEGKLMGPTGEVLLKERLSVCYGGKQGLTSQFIAGRRRKSALWSILAAESWLDQEKFLQAQRCLNDARKTYSLLPNESGISKFVAASDFLAGLQQRTKEGLARPKGDSFYERNDGVETDGSRDCVDDQEEDDGGSETESEEVEALQGQELELPHRSRRISLMGHSGAPAASLETAPLRGRKGGTQSDANNGTREPPASSIGNNFG